MSRLTDLFSGKRWRRPVPVLTAEQRRTVTDWQQTPPTDLSRMHKSTRYVVVDVETSGLNMKKDHLISIGAVALAGGCIDFRDAFQVVLRQDQVSAHDNILIHGIGGSAQSQGVEPVDALLAFLRYIGKSPLVAYHAFFDQTMIDKAMLQYLGMKLEQTWLDLAWVLPELFKYRTGTRVALDDWLQLFAIENIARHNAVSDAYATAKLMQVAIARGMQNGFDSPGTFLEIEKERRWMHEGR